MGRTVRSEMAMSSLGALQITAPRTQEALTESLTFHTRSWLFALFNFLQFEHTTVSHVTMIRDASISIALCLFKTAHVLKIS